MSMYSFQKGHWTEISRRKQSPSRKHPLTSVKSVTGRKPVWLMKTDCGSDDEKGLPGTTKVELIVLALPPVRKKRVCLL